MTIMNDIRAALETKLNTQSSLLPTLFFENVRNNPNQDDSFVRVSLVPTSTRPATRGDNPKIRYDGLFSMLICVPNNTGSGTSQGYVDTILALFSPSTAFSSGDATVSVDFAESSIGYFDEPFYCIPVSVGWHAYS